MIGNIVVQAVKISLFESLLIAALLALTPLLKKRYRARWRYLAWLVIALRLLVPVELSMPRAAISIPVPERAAAWAAPAGAEDIPSEALTETPAGPEAAAAPLSAQAPVPQRTSMPPLSVIGCVWLAGGGVFLLFQLVSYQVFLGRLRRRRQRDVPGFIGETVRRLGMDMGIGRLPETIVTDLIDAPVLIGVMSPRILLPHTSYTSEEIAFILRHELVHYRRRDMWYKLVLLLANAVHWECVIIGATNKSPYLAEFMRCPYYFSFAKGEHIPCQQPLSRCRTKRAVWGSRSRRPASVLASPGRVRMSC